MGQHKHNPIAQLAKEGKLPPKKRKAGKRELQRLVRSGLVEIIARSLKIEEAERL